MDTILLLACCYDQDIENGIGYGRSQFRKKPDVAVIDPGDVASLYTGVLEGCVKTVVDYLYERQDDNRLKECHQYESACTSFARSMAREWVAFCGPPALIRKASV